MLTTHKIVCLVGASGETGRAIAQVFARDGAHLALLDEDEDAFIELARTLRAGGTCVQTAVANLRTTEGMHAGMSTALAPFRNQFDVLISNPPPPLAEIHMVPSVSLSTTQINEAFEYRYFWHLRVHQAALSHMSKGAAILCMGMKQESDLFEHDPSRSLKKGKHV